MSEERQQFQQSHVSLASKPDLSASFETPSNRRESKGRLGLSILRNSSNDLNSPSNSGNISAAYGYDSSRSASRLSFFRTLIGQRNDDYRSDAPQEVHIQRSQGGAGDEPGQAGRSNRTAKSSRWSIRPPSMSMPRESSQSFRQRCRHCLCSMFTPSRAMLDQMSRLIHWKVWNAGLYFFTLVLLFGSQIQALWVPKSGDTVFDILFMVDFVYLFIDICMRCFVEPSYFYFQLCRRDDSSSAWGNCRLGSFMFWCDLISTSLLLYDITFINKQFFRVQTIDITLDTFGLATGGIGEINTALPIAWQPALLVTILRTTRVARFIRASTVVKTSSKVNWYWLLQWFNPMSYFQVIRSRRLKMQEETEADMNGAGEGDMETDRRKELTRRKSWGELALGAMSVVQAKEHKKKEKGLKRYVKAALVYVGILPNEEKRLKKKIIAATKIQRAWRNHAKDVSTHAEAFGTGANSGERRTSSPRGESPSDLPAGSAPNLGKSIGRSLDLPTGSSNKKLQESQVGSAMRELTGQRVAVGVIVAMILTILFTYSENDATRPSTMIVLHGQTANDAFATRSLEAARASSVPDLYEYEAANGTVYTFELDDEDPEDLREWELLRITITGDNENSRLNGTTTGHFSNRQLMRDMALVELLTTIFILLIWFFGVTAFAGPVMTLVVIPIERMIRLLDMLMMDPLGYQSSSRYKNFITEEDALTKNSRWTKEVLKGMETSFLMSTITRIGSLMKVGFGSAGVEIIRNNLDQGHKKDTLFLNSQGSTVACIFLFCDIRQFTDATESLQEEVFLFTNKIAAVVHSICHSYGGSANKNVGDAFLLSWLLEDEVPKTSATITYNEFGIATKMDTFSAQNNQAEKALLSVVKICIALQHDEYYLKNMSETARDALLAKLSKRKGPVVQMGFGLHAGKAIQGALGSQRKIDATYVSEAVETAEFLESSTKKYSLKLLMSDSFIRLLHPNNRRRCRKVDQILINNEEESESPYDGDVMELYTFDLDIDALWRKDDDDKVSDVDSVNDSVVSGRGSKRERGMLMTRRRSINKFNVKAFNQASTTGLDISEEFTTGNMDGASTGAPSARGIAAEGGEETSKKVRELVLPKGPAMYNSGVWGSTEMITIRKRYNDGFFYPHYQSGLKSFYAKDWENAKQYFQALVERYDDGPSKYFLKQIEDHDGVPPRNFFGYGTA